MKIPDRASNPTYLFNCDFGIVAVRHRQRHATPQRRNAAESAQSRMRRLLGLQHAKAPLAAEVLQPQRTDGDVAIEVLQFRPEPDGGQTARGHSHNRCPPSSVCLARAGRGNSLPTHGCN